MLDKCFTCLDDSPVYPAVPKAAFTPNERVWMAESSDFFYGLEGAWPQDYPPTTTRFMRMQAPVFPPVDLGEPVERSPLSKAVVAIIGGAAVWWLIANASRFTRPAREY